MVKNSIIAILLLCIVFLATVVVRLENFHYASVVGMCSEFKTEEQRVKHHNCLHNTETRTSSFWHLVYALFGE